MGFRHLIRYLKPYFYGQKLILEAVFQLLLAAYTPPLRIIAEGAAPFDASR